MSIRRKIILSFLAISIILGLLGGREYHSAVEHAEHHALHEATAVARTVALLVNEYVDTGPRPDPRRLAELQEHVARFKEMHRRDMVIVDTRKLILADAVTGEIGTTFSHDKNNEVGRTIKDGAPRTFTETSEAYPAGIKQVVLPLDQLDSRQRIGAIILEYTPLYDELLLEATESARKYLALYLVALAFSLFLGYFVSRAISRPLAGLEQAAVKVAGGDLDVAVEGGSRDEFGSLARSFNSMVESLRHSREGLVQAEHKFRDLFESATDGFFIVDVDGKFIDVNRTGHERLGYSKDEMLAKRISDINTPEFNLILRDRLSRIKTEGYALFESAHRRKDGTVMPVEVNARMLEYDGRTVMISSIRDITERRRAEQIMRESEEQYRELVENVNSIVLRWSGDGRIEFMNTFGLQFFGYTAEELIGRHVVGTIVPGTDTAGQNLGTMIIDMATHPERYRNNLNENICKDGRRVRISWTNRPVLDPSGSLVDVLSIGNDVTERLQAADAHRELLEKMVAERTAALQDANARLLREVEERERMEADLLRAQKLESLGVLAGGIAHDFNNLLTAILGNISLASYDIEEGKTPSGDLAQAERAALRAKDLTQQLLTFARGGSPVKRVVSVDTIVREAAGFALRGGKVTRAFQIPADLWPANVDEGQISQVINNLVINADHSMPSGGTMTISCENAALPQPGGPALPAGEYVKIAIRDSGVGIRNEHLAKIFDPYFTTKQQGSGLGLATSYSIIQKHGGHIAVESRQDAGTTFTLYLPATHRAQAPRPTEAARPLKATGRVLIMDDEEDVRKTAGSILERIGYSVAYAEDGRRAIELYQQAGEQGAPFDAVIMDLTVPGGMGGQETVKRLRQTDPSIKALVSSGYSNDPVMANYQEYGFAGVVSKPYRMQQLGEAIRRVLYPADPAPEGGDRT